MDNASVSVIVPAYNESSCIERCLSSLREQTYAAVEIIVVDDGSCDGTIELARRYADQVLEQSHKGPGPARNLGALHTSADILVFADADMSFDSFFIEKLTEPIRLSGAIGTYSTEEYVRNWGSWLARCWNINNGLTGKRRHSEGAPGAEWIYRAILRSTFLEAGGYADTGYGEDAELGHRIGVPAVIAQDAMCYHDNPSSWMDVFRSARWYGRGELVSKNLWSMIRHTPLWSIKASVRRAIIHRELRFPIFKVWHDAAVLTGIIESRFFGRKCK